MPDRIRVEISPLRRVALIAVVGTIALAGGALPPAQATSGATIAATSGGNSGIPVENSNTPDADTNTSSDGNTNSSEGNIGTSEGNPGTEEPPPSPPKPPAPPPPPFLGQLKTTIEGQAGNAREGLGYQYETTVHNLGPGTLSGARLRVMLPGRYFIEDVSDRDHNLRSVVRREDESGLPRHWRVWRLADLPAGAEVKFTIRGHFTIRKHQSGDTFGASAAVVLATGGRESDRDDVNVVRRQRNR
jgi:hypothetical protein